MICLGCVQFLVFANYTTRGKKDEYSHPESRVLRSAFLLCAIRICVSVCNVQPPSKKSLLTQKVCIAKSERIYIWPNYLSVVVVTLPFIGTKGLNYIPHLALLPSSKRQRNCDGTCSKNNHRWATYSLTPMRTKVLNRYRLKLNISSSSWLLLYY